MQVILGANGQIGHELARALASEHTTDLRLVSRNPTAINANDQLFSANLLDAAQTRQAVVGGEIVYLTAGLPMDTARWTAEWPVIMENVIAACAAEGAKLVYFDNTYMYPQTNTPQTESTPFQPNGEKGRIRGAITQQLLDAMQQQRLQALICRAPEFYGPGLTQSITNSLVIEPLKAGKKPKVFLRDDTLRSLIFTPDASRAMARLGNTPDAYGQTWHLPCAEPRLTYREFIALAAEVFGQDAGHTVLKSWQLRVAGLFSQTARDITELLPRYAADNVFVSDKFKQRFPDFVVTSYREGLQAIRDEDAN